jgi:hypothetical protein
MQMEQNIMGNGIARILIAVRFLLITMGMEHGQRENITIGI